MVNMSDFDKDTVSRGLGKWFNLNYHLVNSKGKKNQDQIDMKNRLTKTFGTDSPTKIRYRLDGLISSGVLTHILRLVKQSESIEDLNKVLSSIKC